MNLKGIYWPLVLVLVVAGAVYIGTGARPVILDETDGQYAGAAREMLQRDDWLVPSNNRVPRLQKPPLVYWLTRSSLEMFGVNEFAARLPNALATLGWIFATYLIGKRITGRERGLMGAMILASMMGLFLFSHRIMPEPLLAMFISLAVWCFLGALQDGPDRARRWFFWSWVFMGLAVMSKGLHGLLYPLVIAGMTALVCPETRPRWRGFFSWPGFGVFLLICVPWYAVMAMRFPGFLGYHFLSEQVGHAFNTSSPRDCSPVPLGSFWAEHLFFLFPWIFFVPAAVFAWRSQGQSPRSRDFRYEPILWTWILITAVTISLSVRQDHYSMTSWGAAALCLALPWIGPVRPGSKWLVWPCVLVATIGAIVAAGGSVLNHEVLAAASEVKPEAARSDIQSVIRGMPVDLWRGCSALAVVTGLSWLAGGLISAELIRQGRAVTAAFLLGGTMAVVFPIVMLGYSKFQNYFSLADAAKVINRTAEPDALVACEGEPHLSASLFFYLSRQVVWAGTPTGSVVSAERHHIASGPFIRDEELMRDWHSRRQVFFILEESNLPEWRRKLAMREGDGVIVARDGTRIVLVNHWNFALPVVSAVKCFCRPGGR